MPHLDFGSVCSVSMYGFRYFRFLLKVLENYFYLYSLKTVLSGVLTVEHF
ncbi:hypothetical protein ACRRTK_008972 [Alexandromys fortis]